MAARGQAIDGGAGKGGAESAVGGFEQTKPALDIEPVLGSRSYDVMSAIGPLPLQPGDVR